MLILLNILTFIGWLAMAVYGAYLGFFAPPSAEAAQLSGFLVNTAMYGSMIVNGLALPFLSWIGSVGTYTGKLMRPECWKVFVLAAISAAGAAAGIAFLHIGVGIVGILFYFNYIYQSLSFRAEEDYYCQRRAERANNPRKALVDAECDAINARGW